MCASLPVASSTSLKGGRRTLGDAISTTLLISTHAHQPNEQAEQSAIKTRKTARYPNSSGQRFTTTTSPRTLNVERAFHCEWPCHDQPRALVTRCRSMRVELVTAELTHAVDLPEHA